ncbi:unnamed protein product [Caenorhabditis nigoni]
MNALRFKKTPMKATKGVLVVLGTDYAVSMPKAALKQLKKNNPHRADVEINEKFNFTLGENVFDNQDASQKDADDLIIGTEEEDDGHLLTQDLVEEREKKASNEMKNREESDFGPIQVKLTKGWTIRFPS